MNWMLRRPRTGSAAGIDGVAVAGVDARALDVLHDPRHERVAPIADRVDLDLFSAQILVDEHATSSRLEGRSEVALEIVSAVRDLHPTTAEHVRRTYENRVADALGDDPGFNEGLRGPAWRLRDPECISELVEAAPILGEPDGVGGGPGDDAAEAFDPLGEIERRLTAKLCKHRHA